MKSTHLTILALSLLAGGSASAASIAWSPVNTTTEADILNTGTLVTAINATSDGASPVINGVTFVGTNGVLPATAAGAFFTLDGGDTGSASLNQLLDSHTWSPGGGSVTVSGLTAGRQYAVQLIAVGDTRLCCGSRTQVVGDGMGNFSGDMLRSDAASVIGTFTADGPTQSFLINPGSVNGIDPGLSGYQVRLIPEPTGFLLLGLSGLAFLRRRR